MWRFVGSVGRKWQGAFSLGNSFVDQRLAKTLKKEGSDQDVSAKIKDSKEHI